jgi:hypothetical protein
MLYYAMMIYAADAADAAVYAIDAMLTFAISFMPLRHIDTISFYAD